MRVLCLCFALFAFSCGQADEHSAISDSKTRDRTEITDLSEEYSTENIIPSYDSSPNPPDEYNNTPFPLEPDPSQTPGSLCDNPDEIRYPEEIPYCERKVSTGKKDSIIRNYDKDLGFNVNNMRRKDFKIDHYVPLCMGGSNQFNNLWPQHKSLYPTTDPIEAQLCELLADGDITQKFAIEKITFVKHNMDKAKVIRDEIKVIIQSVKDRKHKRH